MDYRKWWNVAGMAVLAGSLALAPRIAAAQSDSQQAQNQSSPQVQAPADGSVDWKGVGVGAATVAANIGYIPLKAAYAILGGITGGASYAVTGGNEQTANSVWRSALGGDYVLTPSMIRGDEPIYFSGPSRTDPQTAAAAPAPAALAPPSSPAAAPPSVPPLNNSINSGASSNAAPMASSASIIGSTHITAAPDAGSGPVGGGSN